jgi:hypothetical protein
MEPSCESLADKMSCAAMIRLAKREVSRNMDNYSFAANSPACVLMAGRPDRQKEMDIIAGNGVTRKLCFDPNSYNLLGPYQSQFEHMRPVPNVFIANTRPKTSK